MPASPSQCDDVSSRIWTAFIVQNFGGLLKTFIVEVSFTARRLLYKETSTRLLSRVITSNSERTCMLQFYIMNPPAYSHSLPEGPYPPEDEKPKVPFSPEDEKPKVPHSPEDELPAVPYSLDDPWPEVPYSLEDPLREVPYSLEDPLREVSILVNNLYVLSDAFCRHLLRQFSSSEDERHIIRDCLTAFSTLENKLVASVPGYYLENPLHDSLHDLVGYIVSFFDFKRLEGIWASGKFQLSKNVAVDHDTHSRFMTRLREWRQLKDESKKRLHLAKTMKPLEPGGRLRIRYDDQLYLFVHELEITGILSTQNSIFEHIYPHDCEMVTSKISQLSDEVHCMLQQSRCLKRLPSGYWNIHNDLRDATTRPDLWESSCLGKLALGESFEEKNRLLLVTGEVGCGKTNLLVHIAKLLLKRKWYAHSDPHQVITHFSEDKNTIQDCFSSLREQFEGRNDTGLRLSPVLRRDTSFDDLGKTLGEFSQGNTNTTYVILDGLDKYDNKGVTNLFKLISTTINSSPKIHWIVSIRSFENSTDIKGISYTLANVSDNEKLKDAAKMFVSMQVDTFFKRTGHRDIWRDSFKRSLMEISKGNLLWITLGCSTIEQHPQNALWGVNREGKDERMEIESLYA
ncbi:hypothetical protein V8C43DRAFT_301918 [Trichoderma afarasin]